MTCYIPECHIDDPCRICSKMFGRPTKYYEDMDY